VQQNKFRPSRSRQSNCSPSDAMVLMLATCQPVSLLESIHGPSRPLKAPAAGRARLSSARTCGPSRVSMARGVSRRRTRASAAVSPVSVARRLFPDSHSSSSTDAESDDDSCGDEVAEMLREVLRRRHAAFQEAWGFDVQSGRPCLDKEPSSSGSQWMWEPL
jgi:hypothetical protein